MLTVTLPSPATTDGAAGVAGAVMWVELLVTGDEAKLAASLPAAS